MTTKLFVPAFIIVGLISLGACSAEKLPPTDEALESKAEALAEQKIEEGKKIYESNCAGCHDSGVSGAPKPGDKEAWRERIAPGVATLVKKSIEGYAGKTGLMPPKGGNDTLTDQEVANAVDFMTVKLK
ncbi:MAG: c-type cytochrome [Chlorobium sp.]|jgi:cytochrome c5|nr:MAG: cytochrome c5 family protein [Chlorobium sp.]